MISYLLFTCCVSVTVAVILLVVYTRKLHNKVDRLTVKTISLDQMTNYLDNKITVNIAHPFDERKVIGVLLKDILLDLVKELGYEVTISNYCNGVRNIKKVDK